MDMIVWEDPTPDHVCALEGSHGGACRCRCGWTWDGGGRHQTLLEARGEEGSRDWACDVVWWDRRRSWDDKEAASVVVRGGRRA